MNCWKATAAVAAMLISSQASGRPLEGSETRSGRLSESVKAHERGTSLVDEDIVRANTKVLEVGHKQVYDNKLILEYAHDYTVAAPYVRMLDLRGKATNVGSFPRWVLDTATDLATETTTQSNTALETTDVQVTGAEIGIQRDVTDAAIQESIIGSQLFDFLVRDAGVLFAISLDDDICALFSALNSGTSVGTSGANLTIANMVEAQATLRKNGARGSLVYILDDQQAEDYQAAQAAATSTTVDSFFTVSTGIDSGYLGTFMGQPVWQTQDQGPTLSN